MQHYIDHPLSVQDVLQRVFAYSKTVESAVPSLTVARKEFVWKNGFFVWRQETPRHLEMLTAAGCADLVEVARKQRL